VGSARSDPPDVAKESTPPAAAAPRNLSGGG
jgi:hypothetical protein